MFNNDTISFFLLICFPSYAIIKEMTSVVVRNHTLRFKMAAKFPGPIGGGASYGATGLRKKIYHLQTHYREIFYRTRLQFSLVSKIKHVKKHDGVRNSACKDSWDLWVPQSNLALSTSSTVITALIFPSNNGFVGSFNLLVYDTQTTIYNIIT